MVNVSIIIPCLNEEKFIRSCLESVMAQDFPREDYEVLVVDGGSADGTRAIIAEFARASDNIRMIDNPRRITPCALNVGIRASAGTIIIRMDAHASYERDYVSKCVRYLHKYRADNVGGTMLTRARDKGLAGALIVGALTSRFGVGNSDFRTGVRVPTETDTVFCGCYPRSVFQRVGFFNERLKRGQDMEFNIRLRKQGGKILLVPEITCTYYPNTQVVWFIRNNFVNGVWAIRPFLYSVFLPVSLRHLVPLFFTAGLLISFVQSIVSGDPRVLLAIVLAYAGCAFFFSFQLSVKHKDPRFIFFMPFVYFCLHVSYGAGSLAGLAGCMLRQKFWSNLFRMSLRRNAGARL
ncbi:MAG TPA: glycosyltransferase family 2 protein [Candidatus Omnitrophota bacterium]|nr:glycosyltransferase family 2 protein [Candidatus Omnitrophota bacterium]HNQ50824.1 glycosyltransferase family 2 protein [Candidatus Omnitrophota bacterium]